MSMGGGTGGQPRRLPLTLTDLLLFVILAVGGTRLFTPLLAGIMIDGGSPESSSPRSHLGFLVVGLMLQAGLMVGAVYYVSVRKYAVSWRDLGLVRPPREWVPRAFAFGVICVPLAGLINLLVQSILGGPLENPQLSALVPAQLTLFTIVVMILLSSVIAPIAEEIAFRGLFYTWLRERVAQSYAIGVSAVVFAILHGIPQLIPPLIAVGVVLGLVREKSRSVVPAIIVHGTFNAIMLLMLYAALSAGVKLPAPGE